MSFRQHLRTAIWRVSSLAAAVALLTASAARADRPPMPSVRLPLENLGFPGHTVALIHQGASMATVHLLDSTHLLFTYSLRTLVPRLPGDDKNDEDRLVAGEVVSVPEGKVLAHTVWHLHDHGQYLWSVGHGVFVLRIGEGLSTFAPLRGLESGEPFLRVALPHPTGRPKFVSGSPDGRVVTVEVQSDGTAAAGDEHPTSKNTVVAFYRVESPTGPAEPWILQPASAVASPGLLRLALDGDGYLWAVGARRNQWKVSFNEFEGKPQDIASIDSSCSPRLDLLSRSQFLVTTCRGTEDSHLLSAYGFDGHETWQEPFGDSAEHPAIVSAPEAGRFALSSFTTAGGSGMSTVSYIPYDSLLQQIRVYQTESGDLLLNVQCMPVVRTAENFDLSPDGRVLAVLAKKEIEIYKLPELTARDRKELAEAQTMAPPRAQGPIELRRISRPLGSSAESSKSLKSTDETATEQPTARRPLPPTPAETASPVAANASQGSLTGNAAAALPVVSVSEGAAEAAAVTANDAPAPPRKRPTLLAPGEKAEFKSKTEEVPR